MLVTELPIEMTDDYCLGVLFMIAPIFIIPLVLLICLILWILCKRKKK